MCEFLTKKGFTAAQIHSMINDSRKLKEWGDEDLADAHYLHSHGRKLYKYMQVRISSLNKCAIAKSIELIFDEISFSYCSVLSK